MPADYIDEGVCIDEGVSIDEGVCIAEGVSGFTCEGQLGLFHLKL